MLRLKIMLIDFLYLIRIGINSNWSELEFWCIQNSNGFHFYLVPLGLLLDRTISGKRPNLEISTLVFFSAFFSLNFLLHDQCPDAGLTKPGMYKKQSRTFIQCLSCSTPCSVSCPCVIEFLQMSKLSWETRLHHIYEWCSSLQKEAWTKCQTIQDPRDGKKYTNHLLQWSDFTEKFFAVLQRTTMY